MSDIKCIYCGSKDNITREHAPPKALFPKPRPHNLITVPVCESCNGEKSSDDEYFTWYLNVHYPVHNNVAVKKNIKSILRGMKRKQKRSFRVDLFNSTKLIINSYDDEYEYLPRVDAKVEVLIRSAAKIAQCLAYNDLNLYTYNKKNIDTLCISESDLYLNDFELLGIQNNEWVTIQENVFSYRYVVNENTCIGVWELLFYNYHRFITFIRY